MNVCNILHAIHPTVKTFHSHNNCQPHGLLYMYCFDIFYLRILFLYLKLHQCGCVDTCLIWGCTDREWRIIAHVNPHFIRLIQQIDLQINHVYIYVHVYLLHLISINSQVCLRECKALYAVFNKLVKASRQSICLHYPQKCFEKNKGSVQFPWWQFLQKQQCKGFSVLTGDQFDLHLESRSFP